MLILHTRSKLLLVRKFQIIITYIYSRNPQGNKVETHAVDWLAIREMEMIYARISIVRAVTA